MSLEDAFQQGTFQECLKYKLGWIKKAKTKTKLGKKTKEYKMKNYKKNPVLLYKADAKSLPIEHVSNNISMAITSRSLKV